MPKEEMIQVVPAEITPDQAKEVLEKEKVARAEAFRSEYVELCKKYNCELRVLEFKVVSL